MRLAAVVLSSLIATSSVSQVPSGSVATGWVRNHSVQDEYQIAWVLAPVPSNPRMVTADRNGILFSAPLLPERLYRTAEPVRAADRTLLIPEGMQMVLMDYSRFLVCSQEQGTEGSAARSNRVCLLDETGDGHPDTYFLRSYGRSGWTTDGMWFAMNRRIPQRRLPLAGVNLIEIDPADLTTKPQFSIRFGGMLDGRQLVRLRGGVDGFNGFETVCPGYVGQESGSTGDGFCIMPPIALRALSRSGEQVQFAVAGVNRSANARFTAQYGSLIGHQITGIRITFNDEAAPTSR